LINYRFFNSLKDIKILDKRVTNLDVLNKIKSEWNNRKRLDRDVFVDALKSKFLTDCICLETKTKIKGYIQNIEMVPFGLLLMSDIQVILLLFRNRIIYFVVIINNI
jgi:hypothetical protein